MLDGRCLGSGKPPRRVLWRAERVLLSGGFTVHQGRAICAVCGAEVGLTITAVVTAHATGKVAAVDRSSAAGPVPEIRAWPVVNVAPLGDVLDGTDLEDVRRWIAMLPPGQAAVFDRDRALRLVEELQRLQRCERELRSRLVDRDDP